MVFSTIAQIAQVIGVSSALMTPVAMPTTCQLNKAPVINITPITKKIQYDMSKTSAQLTAMKSDTISPYGLNIDTTTGGLRHDQPSMEYEIKYDILTNTRNQTFCISYNQIDISIKLQPKIYIAKEYNVGKCGKMVLGHEKKHVTTDRWVTEKYAKKMGKAVQQALKSTSVSGPFPVARLEEIQEAMSQYIQSATDTVKLQMTNEMNIRQQHVDTLEEYERVSAYCTESAQKVFEQQQKSR